MAKKITKVVWESDDGKEYASETEAIRADARYWKEMYDNAKIYIPKPNPGYSSYGSSGGGGHD